MSENKETKKSIKKPLVISICAAVAVILALTVAVAAVSGEGIAKGITVEGQPVAGMSLEKATEFIGQNFDKQIPDGVVTVSFGGADYQIPFADVIMGYDTAKTAEIAYGAGRDGNIVSDTFEKLGLLFKGRNIPLEPALDEEYIGQFINDLCQNLEAVKTDDYYFMEEDKLKLVFGSAGKFVDTELFRQQLCDFLRNGESGRITLEAVDAQPKAFDVNEIYQTIATQPSNTYYEEIEGKKYIMPAKNGYDFDKNELKKAIEKK